MRLAALLILSLLLTSSISMTAAHAQVIQTRVRLKGLDRDLYARVNEPGLADVLILDGKQFDNVSSDSSGGLNADRTIPGGTPTQIETVTILTDPMILGAFKRSPYWSAMSMAFVNATEVSCPPKSEAVIMYHMAQTPRRTVGNCFRFQDGLKQP